MELNKIIETYIAHHLGVKREGNVVTAHVPVEHIVAVCNDLYFEHKLQLKTLTATDEREQGEGFKIFYVFGVPGENIFVVPFIQLINKQEFPSITKEIHGASGYERKIRSFFGLEPVGHPQPQQILLHENWPADLFPLRKDFNGQERPVEANTPYEFQRVEGEGIYEIPVGPVHAGIIEPGHFRFSVAGEEIILLEAKLGYTHKGIEKLFETLPLEKKVRLSERVSGDTSFTHSLAFCQAVEKLAGMDILFSELERLANHFNDIGFIMSDTGYSFGGSHGARLRERVMQWNERLAGSRFLRGVNAIGGVTRDITPDVGNKLLADLKKLWTDFHQVIEISENSSSLLNRLQGTGKLDARIALDHGVTGLAGRAVGLEHDARIDYPYAAYDRLQFTIALENEGDVRSRLYVRIKEVYSSMAIMRQSLEKMADGEIRVAGEATLKPDSHAIGIAEGWRGDIVYFVVTNSVGSITRVDVRDPSFINWTVLGHAAKDNVIPDFPLINKSFNLSYSGNDL
ncbi:MAG: NADH-quinone oxidoreductase subunit C [Deltaproteobacteria bacterium]|nr:NADH-quinone oxidoreductase subunit C [Deltaproteobacteria bacterium]